MKKFVPSSDITEVPVGTIMHLTQNPHLVDMVNAMIRNFGFDLRSRTDYPNRFVVVCDLTHSLVDGSLMEAKEDAERSWADTWGVITDTLEQLPSEFEVPALSLCTWVIGVSQLWRNPNTHKIEHA